MKLIYKIPLNINEKHLSLNKIYAGVHWAIRKKDKDNILLLVRSVVGVQKPLKKPVKIKMSFNSELDVSNHGYLFKMIEDSLVKCKLLKDDNDKCVKQIIMEKQTEYKGAIVEVEELDE